MCFFHDETKSKTKRHIDDSDDDDDDDDSDDDDDEESQIISLSNKIRN